MGDVKLMVRSAQTSKLDGVEGISKSEYEGIKQAFVKDPQSQESLRWLEREHPALHAAITSDLDYSGYTGTAVGSLNSTRSGADLHHDAARRSVKLDKLPPLSAYGDNGLPKSLGGGDPVGKDERFQDVRAYQANGNTIKVAGDKIANITDDEAKAARSAQRDYTTKMSGIIGADVSNPPSMAAARGYFQTLANRGASPAEIKKEYGEYLQTFYRHPGGVDWSPRLDPKNLDQQINGQPTAKDGRRLVDCEGYAAITENVLGGIKKNGQPMFDIRHASNSSHIVAGVFPRGKDPSEGFVVDNSRVSDLRPDPRMARDYAKTKDVDARARYLLRQHMIDAGTGPSTTYGRTMTEMSPPGEKVRIR